jgi:hypothetical protein
MIIFHRARGMPGGYDERCDLNRLPDKAPEIRPKIYFRAIQYARKGEPNLFRMVLAVVGCS